MPDRPARIKLHFGAIVAFVAMIGSINPGAALAQDDFSIPGANGAGTGMTGLDFDAARMSFFSQADSNGDFTLAPDELAQAMAQGGSRLFEGFDLDGDGLIGFEEYVQHGNELFLSLDADGDGILTSLEM